MAARHKETLLCPICHMGKDSGSNLMGKHYNVPGTCDPCIGTGGPGEPPNEDVKCFILNVRFGLLMVNSHSSPAWKWVCACGQHGAWKLGEQQAELGGNQHVNRRDKK